MSFNLGLGLGLNRQHRNIIESSGGSGTTKFAGDSIIILFGDSLEAHNGNVSITAGSEEFSNWSRGYYNWCRWIDPRGRWDNWYDPTTPFRNFQGQDQGLSGNTTTQMLARVNDVTSRPNVKVVILGGGTNDINQNDPVSTILSNHQSMINIFKGIEAKVILMTPPPRPLTGTNSWASGSAQRNNWFTLCTGLQAIADNDPNNVQIVRRDLICSNADTDRTPKTNHIQADNVHLTPIGGYQIATSNGGLIEKLANWVDPFIDFPTLSMTGERVTNPNLSGTSGTVSTGVTGIAPTGFRVRRSSGSLITAVGSKEMIGSEEYYKLVITRPGGGGSETIAIDLGANITSGLPLDGQWMRHAMKIKAAASPAYWSLNLQAREQPSTPANMNVNTMRIDTGYLWENSIFQAVDGGGRWQISPPWQWRTGGTSLIFNVLLNVDNTSSGIDTIWISRLHLYETIDPRPALGF